MVCMLLDRKRSVVTDSPPDYASFLRPNEMVNIGKKEMTCDLVIILV